MSCNVIANPLHSTHTKWFVLACLCHQVKIACLYCCGTSVLAHNRCCSLGYLSLYDRKYWKFQFETTIGCQAHAGTNSDCWQISILIANSVPPPQVSSEIIFVQPYMRYGVLCCVVFYCRWMDWWTTSADNGTLSRFSNGQWARMSEYSFVGSRQMTRIGDQCGADQCHGRSQTTCTRHLSREAFGPLHQDICIQITVF